MNVVALSGSLRSESSNLGLLRAAVSVAPAELQIRFYDGLGALPYFNPDLDVESPPAAVTELRAVLAAADGVLISSPEYAHGVPGSLKNALDWVVSSGELWHKPVVLLNASPMGGEFAQASLAETLETMDANVLAEASRMKPFVRKKLSAQGVIDDPQVAEALRSSLAALAAAIRAAPKPSLRDLTEEGR